MNPGNYTFSKKDQSYFIIIPPLWSEVVMSFMVKKYSKIDSGRWLPVFENIAILYIQRFSIHGLTMDENHVSVEHVQTFPIIIPSTIQSHRFLHTICIAFGIISNLEIKACWRMCTTMLFT